MCIEAVLKSVDGNMSELARRLSISPQAVQGWVVKNEIPLRRVIEVERVTGVHRSLISPKHYPVEPSSGQTTK